MRIHWCNSTLLLRFLWIGSLLLLSKKTTVTAICESFNSFTTAGVEVGGTSPNWTVSDTELSAFDFMVDGPSGGYIESSINPVGFQSLLYTGTPINKVSPLIASCPASMFVEVWIDARDPDLSGPQIGLSLFSTDTVAQVKTNIVANLFVFTDGTDSEFLLTLGGTGFDKTLFSPVTVGIGAEMATIFRMRMEIDFEDGGITILFTDFQNGTFDKSYSGGTVSNYEIRGDYAGLYVDTRPSSRGRFYLDNFNHNGCELCPSARKCFCLHLWSLLVVLFLPVISPWIQTTPCTAPLSFPATTNTPAPAMSPTGGTMPPTGSTNACNLLQNCAWWNIVCLIIQLFACLFGN